MQTFDSGGAETMKNDPGPDTFDYPPYSDSKCFEDTK